VSKPVRWLSEWLHSSLREAGVPVVCIEIRHVQRFLSSRPVKTDRNDDRGIAEMMRLGHYRPVHVTSPAAQSMRTTLTARCNSSRRSCRSRAPSKGCLRFTVKNRGNHRNHFAARVIELLEMPLWRNSRQPSNRCCGFERVCAHSTEGIGSNSGRGGARRSDVGRRLLTIHGVGG
jgi:transposase